MGLLDSLFGKTEVTCTSEDGLLRAILGLRLLKRNEARGYSEDVAEAMTNQTMQRLELAGDLSGDKLWSCPDQIIVVIIKDYVEKVAHNMKQLKSQKISVDTFVGSVLSTGVIEHIERHRNGILGWPDTASFPRELDDYVFYRVIREIRGNGQNPDSLGFSKETVQLMTRVVKIAYQGNLPPGTFQILAKAA